MANKNLDLEFKEAFEKASNMDQALPQDVMLRIYAFYKQATFGSTLFSPVDNFDLRDAFKTNAWIQISHLTPDEAKEAYINTINAILEDTK